MTGNRHAGDAPTVSVVMPAYNCAPFIADAVESVLAQSHQPFEIIVVDDGSTDGTQSALAPYQARIRVVHQANQGPSVARNRGVDEARGELIAFLDADDFWLPAKLEWQVKAMASLPECGLVYTDGRTFGDGATPSGSLISLRARAWMDSHGTAAPGVSCGDLSSVLWFENCVCSSSSVLARRAGLTEVGGFDPALRMAEDYDLWIKMGLRHSIACIDRDLFRYRWREASLSGPASERDLRWKAGALAVVERHLTSAPPPLRPLIERDMAREYWTCARAYFKRDRLREARPLFQGSLRHNPWFLSPVAFLAVSLLGRPAVRAARSTWRGAKRLWGRLAA